MAYEKIEQHGDIIAMSNPDHKFSPSMEKNLSIFSPDVAPAGTYVTERILFRLDRIISEKNHLVMLDDRKQTPLHHLALCMHGGGLYLNYGKFYDVDTCSRGAMVALLIIVGCNILAKDIFDSTAEDIFLQSRLGEEPNHPVFKLLRGADPVAYITNLLDEAWCAHADIDFSLARLPQGFEECALEFRGIAEARNRGAARGFLSQKGCPSDLAAILHGFFSNTDGKALAAVNRSTSEAARKEVMQQELLLGLVPKVKE
jgi:hypothetical protein